MHFCKSVKGKGHARGTWNVWKKQNHWETQYCVIKICYHNRGQAEENTQKSPDSSNHTKSILIGSGARKKRTRLDLDHLQRQCVACDTIILYSKTWLSHPALTSSWQYKTIFTADSQSISLAAKPPIYLCFQIIWQLWSAVNGQCHFSHFTFCFLFFFFFTLTHFFSCH